MTTVLEVKDMYDSTNGLSSLLVVRLHSPVDKCIVLKENINVNEFHYAAGILYFCGNNTNITYLDVDKKLTSQ